MTNDELFEKHRLFIEGAYMAAVQSGLTFGDLVAVMIDPDADDLPPQLRDAFDLEGADAIDMPLPGGTEAAFPILSLGVLDRDSMVNLLTEVDPDIAHALSSTSTLRRAPCLILANNAVTLRHINIRFHLWAPGGDT